jgi:hypothetical protein
MKRILVLGDCIATGQNCLLDKITGVDSLSIEDDFYQSSDEKERYIIKWFLQNNTHKLHLSDIKKLSYKYKTELERKIAWPNFLPATVDNLSIAGETFQGMHSTLKKYLKNNPPPNFLIITDFDRSHNCVVINYSGKKYIVKRATSLLDQPQYLYPEKVYKLFRNKIDKEIFKGNNFFLKKNKKALYYFIKFVERQKINYTIVSFYTWFKEIHDNYIDCCHLVSMYKNNGLTNIRQKKDSQPIIAEHVYNNIKDKL